MAGGISIHVYDVSRGVPAAGLRVELRGPDGKLLVDAQTAEARHAGRADAACRHL